MLRGAGWTLLAVPAVLWAWYLHKRHEALEDRWSALQAAGAGVRQDPALVDTGKLRYDSRKLDFAIVSDLDHASRDPERFSWHAFIRRGALHFDPETAPHWRIEWIGTDRFETTISAKNRSFELSELRRFNGELLAFCDATGIIFKVDLGKRRAYQRWALADGDGDATKPFKTEWAAVKDGVLLIGSMGREWVRDDGSIEHFNGQWVKSIDRNGRVTSTNWRPVYESLRAATKTTAPGYLWHEAVDFDPRTRRWLFLPRKSSQGEPYTPEADETRGSNVALLASEDFGKVEVRHVGPLEPEWGFTAVRKVPGSDAMYLALKAMEVDGRTASKICLFDFSGPNGQARLLLDPPFQPVEEGSDAKYEGLDFLEDA